MTPLRIKHFLGLFALLISSALLVACGGGSGSGNTAGSGGLGIVLTDGPTSDFAEVNVTINEILLIPDDDHGDRDHVVIFQGEEKVNLLNLTDYSQLFAISSDVPAGEYEKIRLKLKHPHGIELVKKDAQGNVIETIYPDMAGNGKLDLNPRHDFHIMANQTLYVQLDIDADKSLHIVQTGNNKYRFRPVIFVDVIDDQYTGKLVRHFGYVSHLDLIQNRFKLCDQPVMVVDPQTDSSVDQDEQYCIKVKVDGASVFDINGDPADLAGLQVNDPLTVIGFVRSYDDDENDDDENSDENDDLLTVVPRHAHGDYDDDHEMRLYAEVIEMGEMGVFSELDGTIASEPQAADDSFGLTLEDTSEVTAQLQTGTKVFSRKGVRLDYQAIDMGLTASVDGVFSTMDPSILKSSLVIVDTDMMAMLEQHHGTVLDVDTTNGVITISTATGDMMLRMMTDTSIFLLHEATADTLSEMIGLEEVPVGAAVDVYGYAATDGYFDVDTLLVEAP
jgi:hypothetical protein